MLTRATSSDAKWPVIGCYITLEYDEYRIMSFLPSMSTLRLLYTDHEGSIPGLLRSRRSEKIAHPPMTRHTKNSSEELMPPKQMLSTSSLIYL